MTHYYKVDINKTEWEIPERYKSLTPIGSGAYGQVWLVNDFFTNYSIRRVVAVILQVVITMCTCLVLLLFHFSREHIRRCHISLAKAIMIR